MIRTVVVDVARLSIWLEEEVAQYTNAGYLLDYQDLLTIAIEDVLINESDGLKIALYAILMDYGQIEALIRSIHSKIARYFQSGFGEIYPSRFYRIEHHGRVMVVSEYRRAPVQYTKPMSHIDPIDYTDTGWVSPRHR